MSRAFVNEDTFVDTLPDRPISAHPNLVTERGLAQIEAALDGARREYGQAQAASDREALAKARVGHPPSWSRRRRPATTCGSAAR
jgi:hypothetical protein